MLNELRDQHYTTVANEGREKMKTHTLAQYRAGSPTYRAEDVYIVFEFMLCPLIADLFTNIIKARTTIQRLHCHGHFGRCAHELKSS